MKKTSSNSDNNNESIEEKKAKLKNIINKIEDKSSKADILLSPFINEIKIMQEKNLSISAQLKALNEIGIKISYKTYQKFIADNLDKKNESDIDMESLDAKVKTIRLNNSGQVKTFTVKDEIKKLGFTWDKKSDAWTANIDEERIEKIKSLKIGYSII
ncbi:MAG: hypothetical protein ACYCTB_01865 [bacterium]